jgi:hypothetical protein
MALEVGDFAIRGSRGQYVLAVKALLTLLGYWVELVFAFRVLDKLVQLMSDRTANRSRQLPITA